MLHTHPVGVRISTRFLFSCLLLFLAPMLASADISRPKDADGITQVSIAVYVLDIDSVDTASQSFTANVVVFMTWVDPRLAHPDAERVSKPLNEVWHPRIQIVNQQRVWKTFPDIVEISSSGEVVFRQRYWGDFSQPLHLENFPFDRQTFKLHMVASGHRPNELVFVSNPISGISAKLSVADWVVENYVAAPEPFGISTSPDLAAGFSFTIEAKRKSGYFWVKVIIPLVFIVMMSWIVFWIDPQESGSQISVAVTSMLTLIAYRFAVGTSMPKLSYLTRLDYFILGGTVLVFASLVEVVITSTYAKIGKVERAQRIDYWARGVFPIGFMLLAFHSLVLGVGS